MTLIPSRQIHSLSRCVNPPWTQTRFALSAQEEREMGEWRGRERSAKRSRDKVKTITSHCTRSLTHTGKLPFRRTTSVVVLCIISGSLTSPPSSTSEHFLITIFLSLFHSTLHFNLLLQLNLSTTNRTTTMALLLLSSSLSHVPSACNFCLVLSPFTLSYSLFLWHSTSLSLTHCFPHSVRFLCLIFYASHFCFVFLQLLTLHRFNFRHTQARTHTPAPTPTH